MTRAVASGGVRIDVTGARGESFAAVARRTGAFGVLPTDSDAAVLDKFADWAIQDNPGFKGDKGDPGGNVMAAGLFEDLSGLLIPGGTDLVQTSGWAAAGVGAARYAFDAAVDAAYVADHPNTAVITANGRGFRLAETTVDVRQVGVVGDGVTDDTATLQAALALGQEIYIPRGVTMRITDELVITQDGARLHGAGTIRIAGDMAHKSALKIEADDCIIEGVHFINPDEIASQTGGAQFGVRIDGHRNTVTLCTFRKMQTSITVSAYGEYYDNKITFNNLLECIGAGDGPDNPVSVFGEDRGDGIADWSGRATVIGNYIQAGAGQDCRAGIVAEALNTFAPDTSGADNASGTIVVNNHVVPSEDGTGRFRRCIHIEGMARVIVEANIVRGFTWWGIVLQANSDYATVRGNIVLSDVDPDDQSGAAWAPIRAGIMVTVTSGEHRGSIIEGNVVVARTASCNGIVIDGGNPPGTVRHVSILSNKLYAEVDTGPYAAIVFKDALGDISISENRGIGPWYRGVDLARIGSATVASNEIDGARNVAIASTLSATTVSIRYNAIRNSAEGMLLVNVMDGDVTGNTFENVATSAGYEIFIDGTGSGPIIVANNLDRDGNGQIGKSGTNKFRIKDNTGFITDERLATTEITSATSFTNTFGKRPGQLIVDSNNVVYVATGSGPTSAWRKLEDGAVVTPA
jgi:hypothetical protein